ncbi:endonuclease [Acidimangrovimonas pyrenivorans]|uniref:Endonuclease n=1 Tax=Acidimangrovimonas pyrenivorans TaxID=2030798 RepID=A0ABV7ADJ1_9RHOB
MAATEPLVAALLRRHGGSLAGELGLDLAHPAPADLFRWLCAVLLLSARISSRVALRAAEELAARGWTTAGALAASTWQDRVAALDAAGYARYDEKTATMLGELAEAVQRDYGGDLTRLRAAADGDLAALRERVMRFKGIGELGADIFCREMQAGWDELYPFADARTLEAAVGLGLPGSAGELAALVPRGRLPALLAALIRARRAGETAESLLAGPSG